VREVAPAGHPAGAQGLTPARQSQVAEFPAGDDPRGHAGKRHSGRFADERHCAAGPRVDLEDVDAGSALVALLYGVLHVHETHHAQLAGERRRLLFDAPHHCITHRDRRDDTGGIA